MHIESINSNKIKVIININEQKKYGVTYESLSYSNANTRKLCEKIIANAKNTVGFSLEGSKLLVEAKQTSDGCVIIYLSKIPFDKNNTEEYLCQTLRFNSSDELLDGCEIFRSYIDKISNSSLYEYRGKYYLYFEIFSSYTEAKKLLLDIFEYAERSNISKGLLSECGYVICKENALQYILLNKNKSLK